MIRLVTCLFACLCSFALFSQTDISGASAPIISEITNKEKVIIDYGALFREISREETRNDKFILSLPVYGKLQSFELMMHSDYYNQMCILSIWLASMISATGDLQL